MSTFIPSGQAEATPSPALENIPFYPNIAPEAFRGAMNIDSTVEIEWVNASLQLSMMEINAELSEWQAEQELLACTSIADTTSVVYGTENKNQRLYLLAVQHLAKARILEGMRNFDSTAEGIRKAEDMGSAIDAHRRESRRAVRAIMGKTGTVVELI